MAARARTVAVVFGFCPSCGEHVDAATGRLHDAWCPDAPVEMRALREGKTCSCGATHTRWAALEYVGRTPDGAGGTLEMRNCTVCRSTLTLPVTT